MTFGMRESFVVIPCLHFFSCDGTYVGMEGSVRTLFEPSREECIQALNLWRKEHTCKKFRIPALEGACVRFGARGRQNYDSVR